MKKYRETIPNLLFLNGGDHFQGTFWYTLFKSEIVAGMVSLMNHDVMALGNHEFDDGPTELKSFIEQLKNKMHSNMSILSCNIQVANNSELSGLVDKSTIRTVSGRKIAIIGKLNLATTMISILKRFDCRLHNS